MCNTPKDCAKCIYYTGCNSAMNMDGCKYCGLLNEEKISILSRIRKYFGKFLK